MSAPAATASSAVRPALLAQWIGELDTARGWAVIPTVLKLTALAFVPAAAVGWSVEEVAPGPEVPAYFNSPFYAIPALLVVAPALETVLMRFLLAFVARYIRDAFSLNLVCALLWGLAHVNSPGWGAHAVWPFYVMGAVFLRLQARSLDRAYGIVILIHGLFNLTAYAIHLHGYT